MDKPTAAEKLAAAVDRAKFAPGTAYGQREEVLDHLNTALSVYLYQSGRDPDTPEGVQWLADEAARKLRAEGRQLAEEKPEKVPTAGEHLAGFIKAITVARKHLHALPAETQIELGLPPIEIRKHAIGEELVPLDLLRDLIAKAEHARARRKEGRPRDKPLDDLLLAITDLYQSAFCPELQNNPFFGITYGGTKDDAERWSGPLLDFVVDVLRSQDINAGSPSAIGRRLRALITEWRMSRHDNPPPKPN